MEVNYLTPEDLAKIFKVPANNIRRQAREHKIPAVKIGNMWRFNEEKVLKYIEKKLKNNYSD